MLGCPMEHLEFSLWFLRERKFIVRADNNQFEITCSGVEAFEADEANYSKKAPLTLPAPAQVRLHQQVRQLGHQRRILTSSSDLYQVFIHVGLDPQLGPLGAGAQLGHHLMLERPILKRHRLRLRVV